MKKVLWVVLVALALASCGHETAQNAPRAPDATTGPAATLVPSDASSAPASGGGEDGTSVAQPSPTPYAPRSYRAPNGEAGLNGANGQSGSNGVNAGSGGGRTTGGNGQGGGEGGDAGGGGSGGAGGVNGGGGGSG